MPLIKLTPDTLDADTDRFAPKPIVAPLFMTSLQKSGTHLLRNILRMFVPRASQFRGAYIQTGNIRRHTGAFTRDNPKFSFGHLEFSADAAVRLSGVRKLLLYRDPYSWVLARARFLLSDQFEGEVAFLKQTRLGLDDILSMMILGIPGKLRPLASLYDGHVIGWRGASLVHSVRYEDLVAHSTNVDGREAEAYFATLLEVCAIYQPDDWRDRVRVGSQPSRSGTARENLSGVGLAIPEELPDLHRATVDYAAPGLRQLLGYA